MFKVIRDFVNQPRFLMMCDPACGTYSFVDVPAGPEQSEDAAQAIWARELTKQGWRITLSEQVCPAHVKQDREGASLIITPNMAAAAFKN